MTATASRSTSLTAAARELFETVDRAARAPEQGLGLPESTVNAFHDHGLYRALCPTEVGGGQCGVLEAFDIIEEVTRADGSAGWVLMAGMITLAIAGAYLGDEAVETIFADPRAVTAGQVAPTGVARRTAEGFEIEGRYGFGSGSLHSTWIMGGFREQAEDGPVRLGNGMPNVLAGLVPRDRVEFLGNWDVIGLEHTWSEDFRIPEQVVPEAFTFPVFAPTTRRGGPAYDIGVNGLTCIAHAAWACGITRRALDELSHVLHVKRSPSRRTLIDDGHFQYQYALAEASLRSARLYARESLAALESAAIAGRVTLQMRAQARLSASWACTQAVQATQTAYAFAGGAGMRRGVLQQCYRDVSAGEQHIFTSHNSVATAGQVMLEIASPDLFF